MFSFMKKEKPAAKTSEIVLGRYMNDGFEEGYPLWEKGESARKKGDLETAIKYFLSAKQKGYMYPALYNSMALAYRKQGDIRAEVSILESGIRTLTKYGKNIGDVSGKVEAMKERLAKAKELLKKQKSAEEKK